MIYQRPMLRPARKFSCVSVMNLRWFLCFTVFPDFMDATKVSFVGLPNFGDSDEKHSMVLIGARKSTSGDYFFLLQNWWDTKYFVEVSGDCMYHCGAVITFVNVPISRRVDLVTYMASYAETCVDTAETYYECL